MKLNTYNNKIDFQQSSSNVFGAAKKTKKKIQNDATNINTTQKKKVKRRMKQDVLTQYGDNGNRKLVQSDVFIEIL